MALQTPRAFARLARTHLLRLPGDGHRALPTEIQRHRWALAAEEPPLNASRNHLDASPSTTWSRKRSHRIYKQMGDVNKKRIYIYDIYMYITYHISIILSENEFKDMLEP